MSSDIILLKTKNNKENNLERIEDTLPIGPWETVIAATSQVFPGIETGIHQKDEEYFVEMTPEDGECESIQITLRSGDDWNNKSEKSFIQSLQNLCKSLGCMAFDGSDNKRIA